MSIRSVTEKERASSVNKLWQRTYKRQFIVETDSPEVGGVAVMYAVDPTTGLQIPWPGTWYTNGLALSDPYYEFDHGAFVESVEAQQGEVSSEGGIQWLVTVSYGPYDTSMFGSDPTQWPIKVSYGGERTDRIIYFDSYGNIITNSALDPFDPPVTIDDSRSTMTVTRNELVRNFDITLAEMYRDSVNSYAWNGFSANTVKCGIINTSDPQYDSNNHVYYLTVTYPFMINRDGWTLQIADRGCNELSGPYGLGYSYSTLVRRPIMIEGQKVSEPVLLNGYGQRLPIGNSPVSIPIDGYKVVDYSGLNINLSLRLGA